VQETAVDWGPLVFPVETGAGKQTDLVESQALSLQSRIAFSANPAVT